MKRMGSFEKARPHVLGFGETPPEVLRPPLSCGICGAEAGELHEVVSLGHEETLQLAASRKVEAEAASPAYPDVTEALRLSQSALNRVISAGYVMDSLDDPLYAAIYEASQAVDAALAIPAAAPAPLDVLLDALQRLVEAYDSDIVPAANPSWAHAQNRAVGVLMRFGR